MPGQKLPEQERRGQILRGAAAVAQARGLAGLTVRGVAEAAGVSVGLVLFHYQSMDALRAALLDWLLERTLRLDLTALRQDWPSPSERLLAAIAGELDGADAVRSEIVLLLEYWTQNPQEPQVRGRLLQALARYRAEVRLLVVEALGGADQGDALAAELAGMLVRSILGRGLEAAIGDEPPGAAGQQALLGLIAQVARSRPREEP